MLINITLSETICMATAIKKFRLTKKKLHVHVYIFEIDVSTILPFIITWCIFDIDMLYPILYL